MIENGEGIEKSKDRKDLVFSHLCLVKKMEKWRDRKLIYFVEKKIIGWKSEVDIYLQLCPHSIKQKTNTFFSKKIADV